MWQVQAPFVYRETKTAAFGRINKESFVYKFCFCHVLKII